MHGQHLTGRPRQCGADRARTDLVLGLTREQFIATLRTGKDPRRHELGERMPWRPLGERWTM